MGFNACVMSTDEVIAEVLPSQGVSQEAQSIDCEGSETTLADCFVMQETVTTCHCVLVQCGALSHSQAGSSIAGVAVIAALVVVVVVHCKNRIVPLTKTFVM